MNTLRTGTANLPLVRIAVLAALIAAAGMVASTAYTREATRVVSYTCPAGERFSVEFLSGHVRLRTGAGIFALAKQPAASGAKYSDGRTVFWTKGSEALLERPGLAANTHCTGQDRQL